MKTLLILLLLAGCASQPKEYCDKTYTRDLRSCLSKCKDKECKDFCVIETKRYHCMTLVDY